MLQSLWLAEHRRLVNHYAQLRPRAQAEEIADEAFARLQEKDDPDGDPAELLWGIAFNVAKEHTRVARRDEKLRQEPCLGGHAIPSIGIAIFRADFDRAMRRLPPNLRAAFALTELRGLTERETAEVLGIARSTVHVRCEAARTILKEELS
jgi:RNA polymerase sigma factor (sigma-70 family)